MSGISPAQERKDYIATQRWENRRDELAADALDMAETLIRHSGALTRAQIEMVGSAIIASNDAEEIISVLAAADTEGVEDEP